MKETVLETRAAWKAALSDNSFRAQFIVSAVLFIIVSKHNFHFLNLWEYTREGHRLHDPVLQLLTPYDFSDIIFFFTYSAIAFGMVSGFANPGRFIRGLQAYTIIVFLRTTSIYFFPLEVPAGMITLIDPVGNFCFQSPTAITKDLFFSGHTATLAFMFLIAQHRWLKVFCGIALAIVPILLMWQHVHYTIDIVFAPIVAITCIKVVDWVSHHYEYGKVLYRY